MHPFSSVVACLFLVPLVSASLGTSEVPTGPLGLDIVFIVNNVPANRVSPFLTALSTTFFEPYTNEYNFDIRMTVTDLTLDTNRLTNDSSVFATQINSLAGKSVGWKFNDNSGALQFFKFVDSNFRQFVPVEFRHPRKQVLVIITSTSGTAETAVNQASFQKYARSLRWRGVQILSLFVVDNANIDTVRTQSRLLQSLVSPPVSANFFVQYRSANSNQFLPELAPAVAAQLRGNTAFKCHSFGAGHISTFDGNYYDFQGIGNYYLFQSLEPTNIPFTVEVRRGLCTTAFESDPSSAKHVTCNRGVAIHYPSAGTLNFVTETEAGATHPVVSYFQRDTGGTWSEISFQNWVGSKTFFSTITGYRIIRGNTILLRFISSVSTHPISVIDLEISIDGISVSLVPNTAISGKTTGLCGKYNGNVTDDFTNSRNERIPTGTSNSDLDGLFGRTFAVESSNSLFADFSMNQQAGLPHIDETFSQTWVGDYSTGGSSGDCARIPIASHGRSTASFLRDSCNNDAGAGRPNDAAYRMFLKLCTEYCETGHVSSDFVAAADCEQNLCTYQSSETRQNLHDVYNTQNLPPIEFGGFLDPRISFRPVLNIGGRYDLKLRVEDRCGHDYKNLSINVICPQTLSASVNVILGGDSGSDYVGTTLFGSSQMILQGSVTGSTLPLSYSWRWNSIQSNASLWGVSSTVPNIFPNQYSKTIFIGRKLPHLDLFLDNPLTPDREYSLEFAATDGCSIVRKIFTFKAGCSKCAPTGRINSSPLTNYFRSNNGNPFGFQTPTVQTTNIQDMDTNNPAVDWTLSVSTPIRSDAIFARVDSFNGLTKVYQLYTPSSDLVFSTTMNTSSDYILNEITGTPPETVLLYNPFLLSSGDFSNLESVYSATSTFTIQDIINETVTTYSTTTVTIPAINYCQYTLSGVPNVQVTASGTYPTDCVGVFNLSMTVYDECATHNMTDSVPFEFACTTPVARIKCHTNTVNYSHVGASWPAINFDISDSYDSTLGTGQYITAKLYGWNENICGDQPVPCDISTTPGNDDTTPVRINLGTPYTLSWTPVGVRAGTGTISVNISNGCNWSSDIVTVNLECVGLNLMVARANVGDSNYAGVTFDYDNSFNPVNGIFTAQFSGYPSGIPDPSFTWHIVRDNYPIPLYYDNSIATYTSGSQYPIYPSLGSQIGVFNVSLNGRFPETIKLYVEMDTGCTKITSNKVSVVETCPNEITLNFLPAIPAGGYSITRGESLFITTSTTTGTSTAIDPANYERIFAYITDTKDDGVSVSSVAQNITIDSDPFPNLSDSFPEVSTLNLSVWVTDTHCAWKYQNFLVKISCPPRGALTPIIGTDPVPYSTSPFLKVFRFEYVFTGGTLFRQNTGTNRAKITITDAPIGSSYTIGQVMYGNTTLIPTVAGRYAISVVYNTGCGADYTYSTEWTATCDDFAQTKFAVSPASTQIPFTDKQNVRMEIAYINWPWGYNDSTVQWGRVWQVVSAPNTSIYFPLDRTVTLGTNTTITPYSVINNLTSVTNVTTVSTSTAYVRYLRKVTLTEEVDSSYSLYPVCFRPDVGGNYQITFTLYLKNNGGANICSVSSTASITVDCSSNVGPVLDTIQDSTATVARFKPSRVWLNASTVTDGDTATRDLLFLWQVVYPNSTSTDSRDGTALPIPQILEPTSMITSFVAQANMKYVIKLSVSDHCHLATKLITITTLCDVTINLENKTLVATYDGTVPVPLMSFGYDHTKEIADFLPAPRCQKYAWAFVDYSNSYTDSLLTSDTEFVKTSGFAGLIAAVVIIAVIVPVIVWLYCTKKACFKSSDPRV